MSDQPDRPASFSTVNVSRLRIASRPMTPSEAAAALLLVAALAREDADRA